MSAASIRIPFAAALLGVVLVCAGSAAQVPRPGQGTSIPPAKAAETPPGLTVTLPSFEFHSGFWMNLHHFLYQQARLREQRPVRRPVSVGEEGAPIELIRTEELSPEERKAWTAGVEYYARNLASRDLLFDGDLVAIKNRLAEWEAEPDLQKSGLRPELISALEGAAGVYRARWWPEHDRANRAWVTSVTPLVEQHGAALARQLARVYREEWPGARIRVDVAVYSNWAGAYTSLEPLHAVIASTDPRNRGPAALEILFHEASHGLAAAVRDAIARECRMRNKPIPRELWHALLFYTTGEMVRRELSRKTDATEQPDSASQGRAGYTPYAEVHGLYARGWQNFQRLLDRHWQPYLDGRIDFDLAMARLVSAL